MNKLTMTVLALGLATALVACKKDDAAMTDTTTAATAPTDAAAGTGAASTGGAMPADPSMAATDPNAAPEGASTTAAMSDSEVLGLLNAVNGHEIAAGTQAGTKKGLDPKVSDFAAMMVKEHTANRDKTSSLGTPTDNAEATAMKTKAESDLADMGKLDGADYQKAFVQAMVKGHTDALALLDDKLIPAAKDEKVKAHLTETRAAVATHLDHAKQLPGAM